VAKQEGKQDKERQPRRRVDQGRVQALLLQQ